jgi:hypothetical protein
MEPGAMASMTVTQQGVLEKKSGGMMKSWQKRYCEIDGSSLLFYLPVSAALFVGERLRPMR